MWAMQCVVEAGDDDDVTTAVVHHAEAAAAVCADSRPWIQAAQLYARIIHSLYVIIIKGALCNF